jgi:hypothetical protein
MRFEEINGNVFYNGDCITGARTHIPDGSVDLIITDPPYGINGDRLHHHYNRDERFVVGGYVEVPASDYGEFSLRWIREAERVNLHRFGLHEPLPYTLRAARDVPSRGQPYHMALQLRRLHEQKVRLLPLPHPLLRKTGR